MQRLFKKIRTGLTRQSSELTSIDSHFKPYVLIDGEDSLATANDVKCLYRLLLFREPESDEVVQSKVGQPVAMVVDAFMASGEFAGVVASLVDDPSGSDHHYISADKDLEKWAADFFAFDDAARQQLLEAGWAVQLMALSLSRGRLPIRLAELIGKIPADKLLRLRKALLFKPLSAGTTSEDILHCYNLFLRRAPESSDIFARRPDIPLMDTVLAAICSPEFGESTAIAALGGTFGVGVKPDASLVAWAQRQFDLRPRDPASLAILLLAVLERPDVAARLRASPPSWPLGGLLAGLRFAAGLPSPDNGTLPKRLQQVATNMTVVASSNIALAQDGFHVSFTTTDPWIMLDLTAEALSGDMTEVSFQIALDYGKTVSHLYLDYGQGFSEDNIIVLFGDSHGFHRAVISAPQKLVGLRWDPAAETGNAGIALMRARSLTMDEYLEADADAGGLQAFALMRHLCSHAVLAPDAPLAATLSRLLSPNLLPQTADTSYAAWIERNEPTGAAALALFEAQLTQLVSTPVISIVVPTYNTPESLLVEMIESVRAQVYPHWQLCIADDASTQPHVRTVLQRYADLDSRIELTMRANNGHICCASNDALALARGEWIAMLDHDDLLASNALLAIVQAIQGNPDAILIYSDEDKIDEDGQRMQPYFKPDYSPELLLAQNYFNHLTVFAAAAVANAGGWRPGYEGSQDHDLILRIVEKARPDQIIHVPKVLYHWRAIVGSTALSGDQKDYTTHAGRLAVADHLQRSDREATVEILPDSGHYRVRHILPDTRPLVSLIIPTRDKASVLQLAVESIVEKSTYDPYEIIVVDNGSIEPETAALFKSWRDNTKIRVVRYDQPFNYSKINNFAAGLARGSVIALVNNDVEAITPDWIEEMTSWALQPGVGCVGAKLYYPDRTLQHGGVIIGIGGVAGHSHKYAPYGATGYFNRLQVHQNLSAVTAACLFVRKDVFDEVGGLEEELSVAFNDVDFCLRVREAGYRNIFTPFAEMYHHESVSRGVEDSPEKMARAEGEVKFMMTRWREKLHHDPFYSPNLSYEREDFSFSMRKAVHD